MPAVGLEFGNRNFLLVLQNDPSFDRFTPKD